MRHRKLQKYGVPVKRQMKDCLLYSPHCQYSQTALQMCQMKYPQIVMLSVESQYSQVWRKVLHVLEVDSLPCLFLNGKGYIGLTLIQQQTQTGTQQQQPPMLPQAHFPPANLVQSQTQTQNQPASAAPAPAQDHQAPDLEAIAREELNRRQYQGQGQGQTCAPTQRDAIPSEMAFMNSM